MERDLDGRGIPIPRARLLPWLTPLDPIARMNTTVLNSRMALNTEWRVGRAE